MSVEPVSERFEDFLMDSLLNALKIVPKYNYDGICVSYTGRKSTHMTEEERDEYIMNESMFTGIIKDWHIRNSGKLVSFKGRPQNLYFKTFLKECGMIWVLGTQVTNKDMDLRVDLHQGGLAAVELVIALQQVGNGHLPRSFPKGGGAA